MEVTNRDLSAATRLLRLHLSASLVMSTEFPPYHVYRASDLVCVHQEMPIGRNGSPAHFAFLGDATTASHLQCGLLSAATMMRHSPKSVLYAGDGGFAYVDIPGRLFAKTHCR